MIYVSLIVMGSAIGFARYAVYAKILSVDAFGYYGLILLVLPFGVYIAHWGLLNTLNVELPIAYGRGEEGLKAIEDRALGAVLVTSAVSSVAYVAVLQFVGFRDEDVKTALLLAAGAVFATIISEFYILMLRVRRELVRLGSVYFIRASAAFCLGTLGAVLWGYEGAIALEIAAATIAVFVGAAWVRVFPRRPFVTETAARIAAGFPLLIADLMFAMRYATDRWFVAIALPDELGQYTFASLIVIGSFVVYAVLYNAFVPQLLYEHGAGLNLLGLRARARRLALTVIAVGAAGFPIIVGLSDWLSRGIFEEYAPALHIVPILYVGAVASLLPLYSVVVLAIRRFSLAMISTGCGAAVAVVGGFVILSQSPSIRSFAWLFLISQIVGAAAAIAVSEWAAHAALADRSPPLVE
jgi:O-antigen/teichoic acid export membrane protein